MPIELVVFVDWNSQIHASKRWKGDKPDVKRTLEFVVGRIKRALQEFLPGERFSVTLRLYCGWHKGFEPTARRKELAGVTSEDLYSIAPHPNLVVRSMFLGDLSLGALSHRIVAGTRSHFPGTCRDRGDGVLEEKMVDTALVSDLIVCASMPNSREWLAVLGEDIDLMPGVYAAESFLVNSGRKIAYLRSKPDQYLNCGDLIKFSKEMS